MKSNREDVVENVEDVDEARLLRGRVIAKDRQRKDFVLDECAEGHWERLGRLHGNDRVWWLK